MTVPELTEKFAELESHIAEEKGPFALFALFLREDVPDRWDFGAGRERDGSCGAERGRLLGVRAVDRASFGAPRGTSRPGQAAATRAIRKRPRCRPPLPAGRRRASPTATANSAEDLVPGDADRSLSIKIIQAPVELFALGFRERDCLRRSCQAVPQLLQQAEPLLCCQCRDVEFWLAHAESITSPLARSQKGERRAPDAAPPGRSGGHDPLFHRADT